MNSAKSEIALLTTPGGLEFTRKIAESINRKNAKANAPVVIYESKETVFLNGELKHAISQNIAGKDVYVVQLIEDKVDTARSCNDRFVSLMALVNAAKIARAARVTAVTPVLAYQRQDKVKTPDKISTREPLMAKVMVYALEKAAGADGILCMDPHSPQIRGFVDSWNTDLSALYPSSLFRSAIQHITESEIPRLDVVRKKGITDVTKKVCLGTPDAAGTTRVGWYCDRLHIPLVAASKVRTGQEIEKIYVIGDVRDKIVIVIDDIIDTGSSLLKLLKTYKEMGALGAYAFFTHPLFNGRAEEMLRELHHEGFLIKVVSTNTVRQPLAFLERNKEWYVQLDVAPLFADAIMRLNSGESLSELMECGQDMR